jgi:hypothetical protein
MSVLMAEADATPEPTLVERWLDDQQQWQRTLFTYLDSMMKNDEFLMHLGNAMRGSLLAGKPYPTAAPQAPPAEDAASADRLDKVLFAVHQLQGQVQEILMAIEELRSTRKASGSAGASKRSRTTRPTPRAAAKSATRRTRR